MESGVGIAARWSAPSRTLISRLQIRCIAQDRESTHLLLGSMKTVLWLDAMRGCRFVSRERRSHAESRRRRLPERWRGPSRHAARSLRLRRRPWPNGEIPRSGRMSWRAQQGAAPRNTRRPRHDRRERERRPANVAGFAAAVSTIVATRSTSVMFAPSHKSCASRVRDGSPKGEDPSIRGFCCADSPIPAGRRPTYFTQPGLFTAKSASYLSAVLDGFRVLRGRGGALARAQSAARRIVSRMRSSSRAAYRTNTIG